jgi:hypothetical protein
LSDTARRIDSGRTDSATAASLIFESLPEVIHRARGEDQFSAVPCGAIWIESRAPSPPINCRGPSAARGVFPLCEVLGHVTVRTESADLKALPETLGNSDAGETWRCDLRRFRFVADDVSRFRVGCDQADLVHQSEVKELDAKFDLTIHNARPKSWLRYLESIANPKRNSFSQSQSHLISLSILTDLNRSKSPLPHIFRKISNDRSSNADTVIRLFEAYHMTTHASFLPHKACRQK